MSEVTREEASQSRPGMSSVGSESEGGTSSENQNPKGRRKRRFRKRRAGDRKAQADHSADVKDNSGADAQSEKNADENGHGLAAPKNSKRRRRRKNWKRKKKPGLDPKSKEQVDDSSVDASVSEAGSTERSGRRRTRRPERDARKTSPSSDTAVQHFRRPREEKEENRPRQGAGSGNQRHTSGNKRKPERNRWSKPQQTYAALDLGTNNCRLLMAVPQAPGRFRVVDAFSRIVRLGEGLAGSGNLSQAAMDRSVEALKVCAAKLSNRPVKSFRLIATEACRRAENGADFLQRVEDETGLKLEIVDRETEARLAVAGCASLVDRHAKGVVLFDIGGGSSELALLDLRKRKRHDLGPAMVSWKSLPLGVVTLSEKHGGGRQVTREVFDAMVEEVSFQLSEFDADNVLHEASQQGEIHLLGTSGTVTTLAGIHLKLPRYDRRKVDGTWMDAVDVDQMIDALVEMEFEERVKNPCIGKDRADLVLAGCAILVAIRRRWPCPRLRVADRGLREGLLTEMMNADNAWVRRPKNRRYRNNRSTNER